MTKPNFFLYNKYGLLITRKNTIKSVAKIKISKAVFLNCTEYQNTILKIAIKTVTTKKEILVISLNCLVSFDS